MEEKQLNNFFENLKLVVLDRFSKDSTFGRNKTNFLDSLHLNTDKENKKLILKKTDFEKNVFFKNFIGYNIHDYISDDFMLDIDKVFEDILLHNKNMLIEEMNRLNLFSDIKNKLLNIMLIERSSYGDSPLENLYQKTILKIKTLKKLEYLFLARQKYSSNLIKEDILVDYDQSSLNEKIIALNEAGVLDFLKNKEPFNLSVNSLAKYLSLCLGERTSSIQSYLNPLHNKNSDQSKSPYNSPKTVEKVKQKLIQIGLKIE